VTAVGVPLITPDRAKTRPLGNDGVTEYRRTMPVTVGVKGAIAFPTSSGPGTTYVNPLGAQLLRSESGVHGRGVGVAAEAVDPNTLSASAAAAIQRRGLIDSMTCTPGKDWKVSPWHNVPVAS